MKRIALGKYLAGSFLAAAMLGMASCGNNAGNNTATGSDTTGNQQNVAVAVITGTYPDTTVTGTASFDEQQNGKVKMRLRLEIPSKANQSVAVHIHENGDCGDNGKNAGGHWNPTGANHGKWGSGSFHYGDIGNVQLDGQGVGTMDMEADLWTIGGDAKADITNKAIVVHGGTDDYTSQPAGNSGARIGCGVIEKRRS